MPEHDERKEHLPAPNIEAQDLQAHFYTGNGPQAKHQSQIVHQKTDYSKDIDEQIFQVGVVNRLEQEYQTEIDELRQTRELKNTEIAKHKNKMKSKGLFDENEAILETFEEMCRKKKSSAEDAVAAKEQYTVLAQELEQTKVLLPTVQKELARREAELETTRVQLEQHTRQVADSKSTLAELDLNGGSFATAKTWYYKKKADRHTQLCRELMAKEEELTDLIKRYKSQEQFITDELRMMDEKLHELQETEVNSRLASDAYNEITIRISNELTGRFTQNYADGDGANYLKAHVATQKKEQLDQDLTKKEEAKQAVKSQVQNAEILDMSQKGYNKTVRAISVGGKMYYDNTQLADENKVAPQIADSEQVRDKIEEKEERTFLEEEKVISQLKNLPILQYMNSDTLMEYMDYDENAGAFTFELLRKAEQEAQQNTQQHGQEGQQPEANAPQVDPEQAHLNQLIRLGLTDDIAFEGHKDRIPKQSAKEKFANAWNAFFLHKALEDATGFTGMQNARHAAQTNNHTAARQEAFYSAADAGYLGSIPLNLLVAEPLTEIGLGIDFQSVNTHQLGELGRLGNGIDKIEISSFDAGELEWLGKANLSALSGAALALKIAKSAYHASQDFKLAAQQKIYGSFVKNKGFHRFGRVMDNASTENSAHGMENTADAVMGGASLAMTLSGIGGLLIVAGNFGMSVLIKKIGTSRIRSGNDKEILNSPHVMGNVKYDKKLINERHFNALFTQVTGLNQKKDLVSTLKVVDGIDLHRGMRQSRIRPNPEIDRTMIQLGYPDPVAYDKIKLKDLHTKIGFSGNWRQTLRNAIEIKGLDYNTLGTRFAKAVTRNQNRYANKKRITRNEMAAKRRETLQKKAQAN